MKYIKTFENFMNANPQDLGRFSQEEELPGSDMSSPYMTSDEDADEEDYLRRLRSSEEESQEEEEECEPCGDDTDEEPVHTRQHIKKVWGDEVIESKKAKPDFLDLDKDGDKKESMKKAAKDAKEKDSKKEDKKDEKKDKKEDKESKGLSAGQKKLPPALQKAILAKKKK